MIFNLIGKNNGVNGSVIKNNGTGVFSPVVGTIYSCTKDLLPASAGINDFYYIQDDNSLLVGQGAGKPLKKITGIVISDSAGIDLSNYVTKDDLTDDLDVVTNNIKALIPDITKYMKSVDIQAALNTKADVSNTYSKNEVDALINAIKAGTASLDLYLTKADANSKYALKNHTHDMSSYLTASDVADFATNSDVDSKIAAAVSGMGAGDLSKADADTYYANINHTHDSQYYKKSETMTSSDISDAITNAIIGVSANTLTKDQAALLYAPINHKHNDVYTKVETNTQISAAIAAAGLTGNKDVDLSAYLTITDADSTYLKKTDAVTAAAVQTMIDSAGHLTNADIAGLLDKNTANTLYQPVGIYLDKDTADTLYQPIGASSGIDADTVQSMIDNAGHLTAADIATMQADIDAAKADASAAKTAAEQAAQDAQDAKTKAESVETIANDAKTKAEAANAKADTAKTTAETAQATADAAKTAADNAQATADNANTAANNAQAKADANAADIANLQTDVQTAQSTADAAKTQAETNAATFADYVKTADLKGLVDQYIKDYLANNSSSSGSGSDAGGDTGGGDTGGGTAAYGSLTPGVISTMNIPKNNNGYIQLTELGCKISEDQIINNQVHFYVMPGSTAVGDYVAKNYPEGLPIPMSFDGETEETLAYKKIFSDNHLEYPGWINGFNNVAGDDDGTYDEICFTGYTILAGWVFGIMMD